MELAENVMQEIVKLQYFVGNFSERLPFWVERITITIMLNLLWKIACYGFNEVFDIFDIEKKNPESYARKRERKWAIKWRKTERESENEKKSMWKMTTKAVAAITNTASKNNWHNARRECSTENGKVNDTKMLSIMHTARTHILLAIFFSLFYMSAAISSLYEYYWENT